MKGDTNTMSSTQGSVTSSAPSVLLDADGLEAVLLRFWQARLADPGFAKVAARICEEAGCPLSTEQMLGLGGQRK